MNIILDRKNARFIEKLRRIFSDDTTVEIIVDRRDMEQKTDTPEGEDDRRQADSPPLKKNSMWA